MADARERLNLLHQFSLVLREHAEALRPDDLAEAAEAIEEQTRLALVELEPRARKDAGDPAHALSRREIEVLTLVADGLPDKQIGARLGISTFTVNKHVSAILVKMQASSRTEAGVRAIVEGFVRPKAS